MKKFDQTNILVEDFLNQAKHYNSDIEFLKVLKSRTYKIANANVLIRAASEGNKKYFFGLNYLTAEEMNNLDNPFIAFVCGSIDRTIIIPAKYLFMHLSEISHDRNGEYKINIDKQLNISLLGKNNRLDCSQFINAWDLLLKPPEFKKANSNVDESVHSIIQGRLIEIGNIRGLKTYCPNKSKKFNDKPLSELTSIKKCPTLEFSDYNLLRQIDVIWFRERSDHLIPDKAFEIEISTGTWSGVGRMSTLLNYSDVGLYVISDDTRKYEQVIHTFSEYKPRYKNIKLDAIGDLYSAELNLKDLRYSIGL